MMNGQEKSDSGIVAGKPTNKSGQPAAELVEPRPETKGNAEQQHMHPIDLLMASQTNHQLGQPGSSDSNEISNVHAPIDSQQDATPNRGKSSVPAEVDGLPKTIKRTPLMAKRLSQLIKKFKAPLLVPARPLATPVLQYDRSPGSEDNFRSSDEFDLPEGCNATGWKDLHVSGSASIASIEQVSRLNPSPESPVIVLDVREESHAIVGGFPGTWRVPNNWANVGKSREEVLADERDRIHALKGEETVQMLHRKDVKNEVDNPRSVTLSRPQIFSEEEVVRAAGAKYVRLMVSDHLGPRAEDVDAFIEMERGMAAHEKLHVHCGVGQGRTGIFIAMHDMLRNSSRVSFEDIINRQLAFNPGRALDFHKNIAHEERSDFRNDRLEFISLFYEYSKANSNGQPLLWSEWLDLHSPEGTDNER
ncbi:type III secretion system effector XopH [Bradyrhizobium sp. RDI18]|uniref:type III secretion system effector XopH n=1 Tax=Bradyrhizobium sp. RDI18 TaxID=3367400 RepID=UPI00370FBF79